MDLSWIFSSETLTGMGLLFGSIAAIYSITGLGKWRELAEPYRVWQPYEGNWTTLKWFRVRMGAINVCTFCRCAKLGVNKEYLYLSPPASFLMPGLQVPWTAIKNPRKNKNGLQFEIGELIVEIMDDKLPTELYARLGIK